MVGFRRDGHKYCIRISFKRNMIIVIGANSATRISSVINKDYIGLPSTDI